MTSLTRFAATVLICITAAPLWAQNYAVSRTIDIANPNGEVWDVIGDFCDIDDWHPMITGCKLKAKDGAVHRLLTLENGATVLEKLIAVEPGLSYTYKIVESPLPLKKYTSTLSITGGATATVTWSGNFSTDDDSLEGLFTDIYNTGLNAIGDRFTQ